MNRLYLLPRYNQFKQLSVIRSGLQKSQFSSTSSSSNSSSSSSDDEKKQERKKSKDALKKLNNLLLSMTGDEVVSPKSKLNLAQPINKRQKPAKSKAPKPAETESPEFKLVKAAKTVAESIGGDVQKTQSELLMKLLNANETPLPNADLKDLVKGMKIDQEVPPTQTKADQVRQILQKTQSRPVKFRPRPVKPPRADIPVEKIDLFGSEPLGIFTEETKNFTEGVENKTWNFLLQRDLKLAVTHPPSNYFQEMILWTEQGKVWKFPIDNEQGLEEEKNVYFTEHVFLDKHLEPWCPPKGPLRHFMELVCVGLSKNPYLTVEAKKEHILWYKNYFEDKTQLLKETGLIQEQESGKIHQQKQIE